MEITVIKAKDRWENQKLRVCGYARVSTDEWEQENSLENQIGRYETQIKSNPGWEFAGVYYDLGISGFKENRSGFQDMIKDAMDGKIDLIITKSVSRFARNTNTMLKYTRELRDRGIGVFFELQNINTLSNEGELMLTILAAFAQAESDSMSENAKLMFKRRFEAGKEVSTMDVVYGYKKGEAGEIEIWEEEANVVRLIFDLIEKGVWVSMVAKYLNNNGIRTRYGCEWIDSAVVRVLTNPDYTGDRTLQKTYQDAMRNRHKNTGQVTRWVVKNHHPAIVSHEQWNHVQEILKRRHDELNNQKPINTEPPDSQSVYPYTRKLYCPYCGKALMHRYENKRKRELWVCQTFQKVHPQVCKGIRVPNKIVAGWGEIKEPITIIPYDDEYGMRKYRKCLKVDFENSSECHYNNN